MLHTRSLIGLVAATLSLAFALQVPQDPQAALPPQAQAPATDPRLDPSSTNYDPKAIMQEAKRRSGNKPCSDFASEVMIWRGFRRMQVRAFASRLLQHDALMQIATVADLDLSEDGPVLDRNYDLCRLVAAIAYCEVADALDSKQTAESDRPQLRQQLNAMNADTFFDDARQLWRAGRGDDLRRRLAPLWKKG